MIYFKKEFVDKMSKKVSDKVLSTFDIEYANETRGCARFCDGSLKAIYFTAELKNNDDYRSDIILKFTKSADDFVFTHIYVRPIDEDDMNEYRYDSQMNLVSKYLFWGFSRLSANPDDTVFCTKSEENGESVDINYVHEDTKTKEFTEYIEFLDNKKIVVNDCSNCVTPYFIKKETGDVYLLIDKNEYE